MYAAVAVLVTFSPIIRAQDYPQWRGQNRDGAASGFIEPKTWPESLTQVWRVEVGEGYATPIVVAGTVYAFTRRDGKEGITALDAGNGKLLWRTDYPAPYKMFSATKAHGEGPKATPLFHHGKLYTLGISGIVSAFDASTGKLLWQRPAPPEQPFYGTAWAPIGEKNLVIVHVGDASPLTALDENTGDVKWTANIDGAAYASPIIAELNGTRQIVTVTQKSIVGMSAADGTVLWRYPWSGDMHSITPIAYGDTILVSSYHMGVAALRAGEVIWETKDVSMFMSNPVLIGDTLFGLSERASGQYFALDAATGKVLWLGPPRQATNTAVTKAGELLFLLNDNAELIVARSSRTRFEPLKRYTVADSATWAQPAISGNRLFVKDVSSLSLNLVLEPAEPR